MCRLPTARLHRRCRAEHAGPYAESGPDQPGYPDSGQAPSGPDQPRYPDSGQALFGQAPFGQALFGQAPSGHAQSAPAPFGQAPSGYSESGYAQPGQAQAGYPESGYAEPGYAQGGYARPAACAAVRPRAAAIALGLPDDTGADPDAVSPDSPDGAARRPTPPASRCRAVPRPVPPASRCRARQRQASLAPQLRDSGPAPIEDLQDGSDGPSPDSSRALVESLQYGLDRARATPADTEESWPDGGQAWPSDPWQSTDSWPAGTWPEPPRPDFTASAEDTEGQ